MTTFLLETNPVDSGTNWYMLFFNAAGACWNGSDYVTYTTDRDTFDMPMAEVGTGLGVYSLAMPALPAGETHWAYYKRIGGTPAHATDVRYKIGNGYCDGSNIVTVTGDPYVKVVNLPADPATAFADALLTRDWSSVTGEAARSVLNALRFLRNKWRLSDGTLTVSKEDDATTAWTASVTSNAAADPITGSDPA